MKVNASRVTLALIGQKLDTLSDQVIKHMAEDAKLFADIKESLDGCDEYPGVRGRLDRLEQAKKTWDKHFWVLYTVMASAIVTVLVSFVK